MVRISKSQKTELVRKSKSYSPMCGEERFPRATVTKVVRVPKSHIFKVVRVPKSHVCKVVRRMECGVDV